MGWEVEFLHALQTTRNGFTDTLWKGVSMLGEEIFVIAVIMFVYWCIDKRKGFKMMNVYFVSAAIVAGVKALVGRVRPFNHAPDKVVSVGEESTDYCFPSGHTNSATTLVSLVVREFPKARKVTLPVGIVVVLLVMFSRMFLGQHYPTDVLAGAAFGIVIVLLFGWLYEFLRNKEEYLAFVLAPAAVIASVLIGIFADADFQDTALTLTGVMTSVYVCYFIEKRKVKWIVKASVAQNVMKYVLGAAGAMLLYLPFELSAFDGVTVWVTAFLRFFLIGVWLIIGAPLVFKALGLYDKRAEADDADVKVS